MILLYEFDPIMLCTSQFLNSEKGYQAIASGHLAVTNKSLYQGCDTFEFVEGRVAINGNYFFFSMSVEWRLTFSSQESSGGTACSVACLGHSEESR